MVVSKHFLNARTTQTNYIDSQQILLEQHLLTHDKFMT